MRLSPFVLVCLVLFSSVASAETAPFSAGFRFGLGWEQPVDVPLNGDLAAQGQGTLDTHQLWSYGWGYSMTTGALTWDVVNRHISNTLFTAPAGDHRLKVVSDAGDLLVGTRWALGDTWSLGGSVGVGVAKQQVQTYPGTVTSWTAALGQTGQVTLVSSWNWSVAGQANLLWKLAPAKGPGLVVGLGVLGEYYPWAPTWKLNDDVAVSGPQALWPLVWTPQVWLGFE